VDKSKLFSKLKERIEGVASEELPDFELLQEVADILCEGVDYYDWVGFYLADPEEGRLNLGPFVGEDTDHTTIDYGDGICGQSAVTEDTFVVQNVNEAENYLSCSPDVKSEIVVPVFKEGEFRGEIDIDSHELQPFDNQDEEFLESIAEKISSFF